MEINKYLKIKSLFFTVITLFTFSYEENCRKYKCGSLDNDVCLSLNTTLQNEEIVTGQLCKNNDLRCPYASISSNNKILCEKPKNIPILQYPGGSCTTNDNCMNGKKCVENKCQGSAEGQICEDSSDCYYGFSCFTVNANSTDKYCNRLKPKGATCNAENECQMHQGCFHGVCTDYFSLPDGTNLRPNNIDNQYSFCASGHDLYGYCDSLKNINQNELTTDDLVECDEERPCRYTSINGTITQKSLCKCGKSSDGARYCPIFGGNINYIYSVKRLKNLVNGDKTQCNTVERGVVCNSQLLSKANDANIVSFNTINTKLNNYHLFAKADECIQKIYFPLYERDADPDPFNPEGKCPIYRCVSTDHSANKTCANNIYSNSEKKYFVDLFPYSCDWNTESCNFDRTYEKQQYKNSQCALKDVSRGKRFPGEACNSDSDCFLKDGKKLDGLGECKNNICTGFAQGANCTDTSQCLLGNYCRNKKIAETVVSTCESQLREGEDCESMFDCRNNFICKDKKCKNQFFMMKPGNLINHTDYAPNDKIYLNKLCESQMINTNNEDTQSTCIVKIHANATDSRHSNLVLCNLNQRCAYNFTDENNYSEIKYEDCACGFNSNAQGYCPSAYNSSKNFYNFLFFIFVFILFKLIKILIFGMT
jgi:hypothetical protein